MENRAIDTQRGPVRGRPGKGVKRFGRVNWLGLATLTGREIRRFTNVWTQTLAAPVATALLFMAVFTLALGGQRPDVMGLPFAHFLAPGILMMTVIQNAFANTSSSILVSKVQGSIVDTLMPPLSPSELLTGFVLGGVFRGLFVAAGVAAGLSNILHQVTGEWLICGDAIADPLTGLHAALMGWASWLHGGGHLLDLSLEKTVRYCIAATAPADGDYSARQQRWTQYLQAHALEPLPPRCKRVA